MGFLPDFEGFNRPGRPKILIVDDQRSNVLLLRELFRNDCDIVMATDGEQAVRICAAQMPDLILLDVVMEGIDGHEVCRRLKSLPATQAIPIIFITSQMDESDEVKGLTVGAVDFISKPINPTIVRARVRTHLTLKIQSDILRASAFTDGLTGVANRRRFDEMMLQCWRQSIRHASPLSLLLMDIDYFKLYNDGYGHQAGDACLQKVAGAIAASVKRPFDLVARYGGEEFACVLPQTDPAGALLVAEVIRKSVEKLGVPHKNSKTGSVVTLSVGVATTVAREDRRWESLIAEADQQLYASKNAGRNRVSALAA